MQEAPGEMNCRSCRTHTKGEATACTGVHELPGTPPAHAVGIVTREGRGWHCLEGYEGGIHRTTGDGRPRALSIGDKERTVYEIQE